MVDGRERAVGTAVTTYLARCGTGSVRSSPACLTVLSGQHAAKSHLPIGVVGRPLCNVGENPSSFTEVHGATARNRRRKSARPRAPFGRGSGGDARDGVVPHDGAPCDIS